MRKNSVKIKQLKTGRHAGQWQVTTSESQPGDNYDILPTINEKVVAIVATEALAEAVRASIAGESSEGKGSTLPAARVILDELAAGGLTPTGRFPTEPQLQRPPIADVDPVFCAANRERQSLAYGPTADFRVAVTGRAEFTFRAELMEELLPHVLVLSANHYDAHCRSISRVGGFLYGWSNCLLMDGKAMTCNSSELDTLMKVLEAIPQAPTHMHAPLREFVKLGRKAWSEMAQLQKFMVRIR